MDRDASEADDEANADSTDVRYDDWPVEGRESTEGGTTYLGAAGTAGGTTGGPAVVYDQGKNVVFEADVDEERQQLVPRSETEREIGPTETLGDVLEDLGDRLEWDSLSAFAREHLREDDEQTNGAASGSDADPVEAVTFTQSNVSEEAAHDLEFSGSYTYQSGDGQATVLERTFEVSFEDRAEPTHAIVEVTERLLGPTEPAADRRNGDAEVVEETDTAFGIDLEDRAVAGDRHLESVVEERCEQWHESHLETRT